MSGGSVALSLAAGIRPSVRDVLEGESAGARSEQADGEHYDQHGCSDEGKDAGHAEIVQEKTDEETGKNRAQTAPGADEAYGLGADAGGEQFGLVGVEGHRHPVVGTG